MRRSGLPGVHRDMCGVGGACVLPAGALDLGRRLAGRQRLGCSGLRRYLHIVTAQRRRNIHTYRGTGTGRRRDRGGGMGLTQPFRWHCHSHERGRFLSYCGSLCASLLLPLVAVFSCQRIICFLALTGRFRPGQEATL